MRRKRRILSIDELYNGIINGNKTILAQAITLIESSKHSDKVKAHKLFSKIINAESNSIRVGITGLPGSGKSTLLDVLGMHLISIGKKVAVLAIDPSSELGGGSILGDKTRMNDLSVQQNAFIRPTPNQQSPGGVARNTMETVILCEAAGYDIIFVETVGVGQSEVKVSQMVDCFVSLIIPGSGDELQGIKKGVLELSDILIVNKADGDNKLPAQMTKQSYISAFHYLRPRYKEWKPPVILCSALESSGISELWDLISQHSTMLKKHGFFYTTRAKQRNAWMWSLIEKQLISDFKQNSEVIKNISEIESKVIAGDLHPTSAASYLLNLLKE